MIDPNYKFIIYVVTVHTAVLVPIILLARLFSYNPLISALIWLGGAIIYFLVFAHLDQTVKYRFKNIGIRGEEYV